MIYKILSVFALLASLSNPALAAGEASFSKGHPMWDATGVNCSSGTATATQITVSTPGFVTSGVRLINQSAFDVWIGYDNAVSTKTLIGDSAVKRGEKLAAGASGVWELGYDSRAQVRPKMFCRAADAAGATTAALSVAIFAY